MEPSTGKEYFLKQLSTISADLGSLDAQSIKEKLVLYPNQAVSIYDYTTFELKYVDGFEIFGMKDDQISMVDVFNTAIPEHRDICGELSGKTIQFVKAQAIDAGMHMLTMNYAGQHIDGTLMHIMLQGKMFETTDDDTIKSACTMMTYVPHLKPPKIVTWSVYGPAFEQVNATLDKNIVSPNHIRTRELEVLQLTANGQTMMEISTKLNISDRTVEKHLENLRIRFNCQNSTQLIAFAKDAEIL